MKMVVTYEFLSNAGVYTFATISGDAHVLLIELGRIMAKGHRIESFKVEGSK